MTTQRTPQEVADDVVSRVLSRVGTAIQTQVDPAEKDQWEIVTRSSLRRVPGLSTELTDVTEVEYRQLRLEKVVLVGLWGPVPAQTAEVSLRELAALAETAGSQVMDGLLQRRTNPDPSTYLGSGKAKELAELVAEVEADTVVVDGDLSPSQRRALEDVVQVKVVDRTALILDIFAQHAKSREGKAQVELAQLEYLLPRLRGWGDSMSRQAGGQVGGAGQGMGSRGPGETKIELDRRRIRTRMAKLRRQIAQMKPSRQTRRNSRQRSQIASVAIVGYTNAGKSSLLNRLTGAGVLVENALFATLDPTVRRARTADGQDYTLTDTVGFVRALPHQLVEAFRSTLEEVSEADLLLHVVDAAHPDPEGQIAAVREVLHDLPGVENITELIVLNKADLSSAEQMARLRSREPGSVVVSAHTGAGFADLEAAIAAYLPHPLILVEALIPFGRGDLVDAVHRTSTVELTEHVATGTLLRARVEAALADRLERELGAEAVARPLPEIPAPASAEATPTAGLT